MRGCLLRGEFESANPALAALKDRPRDQSGKDRILLANPQENFEIDSPIVSDRLLRGAHDAHQFAHGG